MKRWRTETVAYARRASAFALLLALLAWPFTANAQSRAPARNFVPAKLDRVGDYIGNEVATGKDSGVARDHYYFPGDGFGMALGLAVRTEPGNAKPPPPGSLGELKWDGASGCYMVIDQKQEMFFVLLEQTPSERQRIQRTLKLLVYEALKS